MRKMLVNARHKEELRVAIIDNENLLYDLYIENMNYEQKKSNIYKGKIVKIEPSLNAAFVDYGCEKNGFLSIKEINDSFFIKKKLDIKVGIKDILKENQEIMVQVNKEERGKKGAYLSTFISLAGSYLILMPNNPNVLGISRRIKKELKFKLKDLISKLIIPENMGIIIRTSGINKSLDDLQTDLNMKLDHWNIISKIYKEKNNPSIIYNENNIVIKIFRDYLNNDIDEIIIDELEILELSKEYLKFLGRNDFIKKLKLHVNNIPLFYKFNIESQIKTIFKKKVNLPSGGSIIIDSTEALTSIDINSSKYTKGINIEETALNTNIEAAKEIVRQIKFRDLGGLIVIDFIDMLKEKNKKDIENLINKLVLEDRSKVQVGVISKFGLLELSRQRINNSINEFNNYICPRCEGIGYIKTNKNLTIYILRIIEEKILNKDVKEIHIIVPVIIGTYLLNEKRNIINELEYKNLKKIVIIPSEQIKTPNYTINTFNNINNTIDYSLFKINKKKIDICEYINKNNSKLNNKYINFDIYKKYNNKKLYNIKLFYNNIINKINIIKNFFINKIINKKKE
ncbi:ribonuclease E [endosymbiont of Sipalinus gigas]|uniref:Rne/Rng family ribonuclease n=1 Tax=endosymbiont of Sipalinus gigas TaxID=1972134 RepID=UPI000DC6E8EB|nr:Rne/Rng family ribonuclease [endosymbiont of Sipalinus gigas]BBA85320.1 ribonuclease E [endosymbiont of Sipalinus gigas]